MYCIGFCSGSGTRNGNNAEEGSTDLVEAPYKFPLQQMINGILNLLHLKMLKCEDVLLKFKEILDQLRTDCDTCDDSSELFALRDEVEDFVFGSLEKSCGCIYEYLRIEECSVAIPSQGWNQDAIERTTEIVNLVNDLPASLKMKVQANSTILQNIDEGKERL